MIIMLTRKKRKRRGGEGKDKKNANMKGHILEAEGKVRGREDDEKKEE